MNIPDIMAQQKQLEQLIANPDEMERFKMYMSVVIYRLEKILTDEKIPPGGTVHWLLSNDLNKWKIYDKNTRSNIENAISILSTFITYQVGMANKYLNMYIKYFFGGSKLSDVIYPLQKGTRTVGEGWNDEQNAWGKLIPFRPILCSVAMFAMVFPVYGGKKVFEFYKNQFEQEDLNENAERKTKSRQSYQRSFATILDAIDYESTWWAFLIKSELNFDSSGKPIMDESAVRKTIYRPKRLYSTYWRKPTGSISPDVILLKNGKRLPDQSNITHCVDMKFPKDTPRDNRTKYNKMFGKEKVYFLYYPHDCGISPRPEGKTLTQEEQAYAVALATLFSLVARRPIKWTPYVVPTFMMP